VEAYKEGL